MWSRILATTLLCGWLSACYIADAAKTGVWLVQSIAEASPVPNVTGGNRSTFGGSAKAGGNTSGGRSGQTGQKQGERPKEIDPFGGGAQTVAANTPNPFSQGGGARDLHAGPNNKPGGGTTTQFNQTPGAVPNFPDAESPLTNLGEALMIGPTGPVSTATMLAGGAYQAITKGKVESPFSNTGPQRGWQPDKYRGEASLGGVGGVGGAVNSGEGPMLNPASRAVVGDSSTAGSDALMGVGGDFSDVSLQDVPESLRRRPKLAASSMVAGAL